MGGVDDYIAYLFKDRGFVILECLEKGNALYVFGSDWEKIARLTKAQILSGNLHMERIVHTKGWKIRLAKLFNDAKPGEVSRAEKD